MKNKSMIRILCMAAIAITITVCGTLYLQTSAPETSEGPSEESTESFFAHNTVISAPEDFSATTEGSETQNVQSVSTDSSDETDSKTQTGNAAATSDTSEDANATSDQTSGSSDSSTPTDNLSKKENSTSAENSGSTKKPDGNNKSQTSGSEKKNTSDNSGQSDNRTTTGTSDTQKNTNTSSSTSKNDTGSSSGSSSQEKNQQTPTTPASKTNTITFQNTSISTSGSGMSVSGSTVTITKAGSYRLSGSLSNGRIIVNVPKTEEVELILTGVNVTCSNNSPLYVQSADCVTLTLDKSCTNQFTDGKSYADTSETAPSAAIYSEDDIKIQGEGALTVHGNYRDGISSKNDVILSGGTITIDSADDGIRGKDSVRIKGASVSITSLGHGIKVTNDTDSKKGYFLLSSGSLRIDSEKDGCHISQNIELSGGNTTIKAGNEAFDVEKNIQISGGSHVLAGSKGVNHGVLSYNGECVVTGGTLVAFGNQALATGISSSSSQKSILYKGALPYEKNLEVKLTDSSEKTILSLSSIKQFQSVLISSPEMKSGTYSLFVGGRKIGELTAV